MFVPIILILMIFSMASFFTYTQENPPAGMTVKDLGAVTLPEETTTEAPNDLPTSPTDGQPAVESPESISPETAESSEIEPVETPEEIATESNLEKNSSATPSEEEFPTEETTETKASAESAQKNVIPTPAADVQEIPVDDAAPAPEELESPSEPIIEEETVIPEESIAPEEPVGIDTVSLENPQGNWLFKRIWWERAEERYEKIRVMVDSIWESRNKFFYERNQLDRNVLDPFYITIGIDRAELQIMLSEIKDFVEKQREKDDDLSEQERMLVTEEERLKQLKIDVDMITNLDHAIDDALGTFMNQINRVRNYEAEAWKNFKEIAHILNDTRARELYYMIEGAARNIKTISTYLEQEFFTHFNKLINDAKARVARVQNQMEALKEKGVIFQRQAEQVEEHNAQKEDTEQEEEDEEVSKPKKVKSGWFDTIYSGISSILHYAWSLIRLPYDLIFGKK